MFPGASSFSNSFTSAALCRFVLLLLIIVTSKELSAASAQDQENEPQQPRTTTTCDESKCRTLNPASVPGYWWLPLPPDDFAGGYTCWSPVTATTSSADKYPCVEGYEGKPVPDVTQLDEDGDTLAQWYTCCPNDQPTPDVIEQTCTDMTYDPNAFSGWAAPDGLAPRRCLQQQVEDGEDNIYKYPRNTGAILPMDHANVVYDLVQFLCCKDPPLEDEDFLDPLDEDGDLLVDTCSTAACTSLDGVGGAGDCWADGVTEPFTCNTQDKSNPYIHPTRNGHEDLNLFNFHYVCCMDKHENHPYEEENKWDGLQVALLIQSIIAFITFVISSVFTLGILTNTKARSQAWNIYLVMVSIPDVIYNLFRFIYGIVVITRTNTFITTTWTIDWFYAVANLLLNAVIVYEVHKFLRAFKQMVRIPPPNTRNVLLQSFVVYIIAAGCGVWMLNLHAIGIAFAESYPRFLQLHKISLCTMVIPPVIFVALICMDVWFRQLLPTNTGRTRTLALYFLRVIFVFMATWLPYMVLITVGLQSNRILGYIGLCISSFQGTLSVLVAMSKLDVQWAVESFITCQCNADPPKEGEEGATIRRFGLSRNRISTQGSVRISGLFSNAATETKFSHVDNPSERFNTNLQHSRVSAVSEELDASHDHLVLQEENNEKDNADDHGSKTPGDAPKADSSTALE